MVLAPTVDLAAVSLRKPLLNSNTRNGAKVPRGCEASWERLETATPATTPALPVEHSATRLLNKLGNYHCTNRVYSIQAGRSLSPDQAANPAYNLFDYVGGAPLGRTDGTGLYYWDPGPTGIRIDGPSNMAGDGSATGTWDPSSKYTMFKNGEGFGFAIKFHVHPDWYAKGYRFTQVVYIRTRFWCCCDDKVRERREYYIEMFDNESYVDTMLSRKQASVVGAAECPAGLKKIDQQRILISFIAKPTPAIRKALDKAGTKEDPPFRAVDLSDNLPKEEGCKNMRYERPDAGVAPGNKISDLIDGLGVGVPVVSRIYWTAEFDCNNKSAFLGARLTGVLDSGRYAFSSVSGQAVNHVD